jgi:hypothetical protein
MDSTGSQGTNHGAGPVATLEFQETSNRGRQLPPEAIEFGAFLKTYTGDMDGIGDSAF